MFPKKPEEMESSSTEGIESSPNYERWSIRGIIERYRGPIKTRFLAHFSNSKDGVNLKDFGIEDGVFHVNYNGPFFKNQPVFTVNNEGKIISGIVDGVKYININPDRGEDDTYIPEKYVVIKYVDVYGVVHKTLLYEEYAKRVNENYKIKNGEKKEFEYKVGDFVAFSEFGATLVGRIDEILEGGKYKISVVNEKKSKNINDSEGGDTVVRSKSELDAMLLGSDYEREKINKTPEEHILVDRPDIKSDPRVKYVVHLEEWKGQKFGD